MLLFDFYDTFYFRKELSMAEVSSLLEEGRYFTGCQYMKSEQHERAIEFFRPLRNPYASFNQALVTKLFFFFKNNLSIHNTSEKTFK